LHRFPDYVGPEYWSSHSIPEAFGRNRIAGGIFIRGNQLMQRPISGIAALLCAAGGLAAGAGSASAATTNPFGCTASTAVATLGSTNLLPGATNANAQNTPCASDQELLASTTINPAGLGLVSATVGPASATTTLS